MDEAQVPNDTNWRAIAVLALLAAVVWWLWRLQDTAKPKVPMLANTPAPQVSLPGVSSTLLTKIARVPDVQIPVVMTSGSVVPYGEDEVRQIVRRVLERLNAMGESVSLIQVVSVSKTLDSYKTVAYELVISVHDSKQTVGMMLSLSVLVPVSGEVYVRSFRPYNTTVDTGPPGAGDHAGSVFAEFEDPVAVLHNHKLD